MPQLVSGIRKECLKQPDSLVAPWVMISVLFPIVRLTDSGIALIVVLTAWSVTIISMVIDCPHMAGCALSTLTITSRWMAAINTEVGAT